MGEYVKLAEAPTLMMMAPKCGACYVDLESDDGYVCPVCGTFWSYEANDEDQGTLYESWSGETLDSEPIDEDAAMTAGHRYTSDRHKKIMDGLLNRPAPATGKDEQR